MFFNTIIVKYKNIDSFTLNQYLINKINFDRISLDRRLHIAPPLGETNYKIDDIYSPYPIEKYEDAEKEGIKKVIELSKFATGEILFFSVTEPAINKIVLELNKNIPGRWIALPYYSTISPEWKNIIENINTKINTITLDKKDILKAVKGIEYNNTSNNKYDHAIIVSTNIAEASITLPSLKFVIDTGYVNVVSFDPILEIDVIGPQKITESARIQRRGRVGRQQ
jgi:HrpA-like RNA helicase